MSWTFLTGHAAVLMVLSRDPAATLAAIARATGLTERRVQSIVGSLRADGYVRAERIGRRRRYSLALDKPLRRAPCDGRSIGNLVEALGAMAPEARTVESETQADLTNIA